MNINGAKIRTILLQEFENHTMKPFGSFQSSTVLKNAASQLRINTRGEEAQALLTVFYDLFRAGVVAWGQDLDNPDPPFMHLTKKGRDVLAHLSRDPNNPDGYMSVVRNCMDDDSIAFAYIDEALQTYQTNCIRASAVMVGAAAESLVLDLRDQYRNKLSSQSLSRKVPAELNAWQIKKVYEGLRKELEKHKKQIPQRLYERFTTHWTGPSQFIRILRNDAGHPSNLGAVTEDAVHAALLLFPEFAALVRDLGVWIENEMK